MLLNSMLLTFLLLHLVSSKPNGPATSSTRPGGQPRTSKAPPSSSSIAPSSSSSLSIAPPSSSPASDEESRTLEQIYQAALAEGGTLVVYAGGDEPTQQDFTKIMFEQRFPGMNVTIVVDYSKFHDVRIDGQLAAGQLIPDVVQLQTLHDFPRWKRQGVLMQYKPRGWSQVYPDFRDADGYFLGTSVIVFSNVVDSQQMANQSEWPRVATDFLRPEFMRKLVITYPNDDDAVAFLFKQIIDKYGWKWYEDLVKQEPFFVRGTALPQTYLGNGTAMASLTAYAPMLSLTQEGNRMRFPLPANNDPFVTWAQQIAIFNQTKRPEAAKLFLNWQLDNAARNDTGNIWSVRRDFQPPTGQRQIWEYPHSSHQQFLEFMMDREGVEHFKTQIYLYSGEAQGPPAAGVLGPNPTQSCQGPDLTNCGGDQ